MPPALTIELPYYNAMPFLLTAVRLGFAQDFEDWHLTLIHGGSSDNTADFVSQPDNPRVRIISDGESPGLAARLKQLAAKTTTKLPVPMPPDNVGLQTESP